MISLIRYIAVALLAITPLSISATTPLRTTRPNEDNNNQEPFTDHVPEFLRSQTNRLLAEEQDGQELGQRCGRNTECIESLECNDGAFSNRCLPPQTCLQQRLAAFEQEYGDMEDYKALVLNHAGTSHSELVQQIRKSNRQGNFSASQSTFRSVVESIEQVMAEPAREIRAIMRECGVTSSVSGNNSTSPKSPTQDEPPVDYIGYHIEGGLFVEGSFSYFQATTPTGYQQAYCRFCLGLQLGGGAEFSILFGSYPQGSDVVVAGGGSFYTGVDIGLGLHVGAGGGVNFQGLGYFEIAFGIGVGIGVGGSICYAFDSEWDGVPPFPLPLPPWDDP